MLVTGLLQFGRSRRCDSKNKNVLGLVVFQTNGRLEAMHSWKDHVHQYQIRKMLTGQFDSLLPCIIHENMEILRVQTKLEQRDRYGIVLDNQDLRFFFAWNILPLKFSLSHSAQNMRLLTESVNRPLR